MQRHLSWFFAGIVILFALAIYTDLPNSGGFPNLRARVVEGLDIKGGVRVLLCTKKSAHATSAEMNGARGIIEQRMSGFGGLTSPQVSVVQSTPPCIDAELPGVKNQTQVINTIGTTGQLVLADSGSKTQSLAPHETVKLTTTGVPNLTHTPPIVKTIVPGKYITAQSATIAFNSTTGAPEVDYTLHGAGSTAWCTYTTANVNVLSPIILDNKVVQDLTIQSPICGGNTQITGVGLNEAKTLAILLNYGALPVSLQTSSIQTVSATLGSQYVHKAEIAGVVGLILVALFMLLYYRLPGLLADLALLIYAAVVFALFKLIPVTLTLPGIAGFILSIGMAVDANVLIFERLKEELRAGKTLGAAIDSGFNRAWTSIRDSNISTMITTVILYWFGNHFGTTIITSFATTLFIGVAVSMFTAIMVTRTFLRLLVASGRGRSLAMFGIEDRTPRAEPAVAGGSVV
jgi:preprotein translocase subunit SecD